MTKHLDIPKTKPMPSNACYYCGGEPLESVGLPDTDIHFCAHCVVQELPRIIAAAMVDQAMTDQVRGFEGLQELHDAVIGEISERFKDGICDEEGNLHQEFLDDE